MIGKPPDECPVVGYTIPVGWGTYTGMCAYLMIPGEVATRHGDLVLEAVGLLSVPATAARAGTATSGRSFYFEHVMPHLAHRQGRLACHGHETPETGASEHVARVSILTVSA
jgi:hypothetical protein